MLKVTAAFLVCLLSLWDMAGDSNMRWQFEVVCSLRNLFNGVELSFLGLVLSLWNLI